MHGIGLNRFAPALIMLLAACAPTIFATSAPQPLPSPDGAWTVTLRQSGGFVGVLLTLEVSSRGQLTAEDQRSGRKVTQNLSPEALAKLTQLYSGLVLATPAAPHSSCADCFNYDLELSSGGGIVQVHADDTTLPSTGAAELISFLRQLRDSALQAAP